jgi:hypothetical protein
LAHAKPREVKKQNKIEKDLDREDIKYPPHTHSSFLFLKSYLLSYVWQLNTTVKSKPITDTLFSLLSKKKLIQ